MQLKIVLKVIKMKINNNDVIEIKEGFNEYIIDTNENISININAYNSSNSFIRIINAKNIKIESSIKANNVTIVFWNDSDNDINSIENYDVLENTNFTLAYGECNNGAANRNIDLNIIGSNSEILLSSASLVSNKKNYRMNVVNKVGNTIANIKNFAVVLNGGNLMIDAIGKIEKNAKRSASHQTSRALSFEEGQNTTILPELLIDENDVQASHAMTIGRVDENQLYYLMSRGLNVKECTSLISKGYLLPITDLIENEEIKNKLIDELERKINQICSM